MLINTPRTTQVGARLSFQKGQKIFFFLKKKAFKLTEAFSQLKTTKTQRGSLWRDEKHSKSHIVPKKKQTWNPLQPSGLVNCLLGACIPDLLQDGTKPPTKLNILGKKVAITVTVGGKNLPL